MQVRTIRALSSDIDDLAADAQQEGFRFLTRLIDEWNSGMNRFDRPHEALFVIEDDRQLVGVCGVNVDPYTGAADVARLRHLYVKTSHRRRGFGGTLVRAALAFAQQAGYSRVHLRTDTPAAVSFYVSLGFKAVVCPKHSYTHALDLTDGVR